MSKTKKVLVTGASGFIGAACIGPLQARGYEVHAASLHPRAETAGVRWHHCDFLDAAQCIDAIHRIAPTHLLHLAWITTPGEFWASPLNARWLSCSTALVDAFFSEDGERAVGLGTCAEYAWQDGPCREDETPLEPDSLYGRCKLDLSRAFSSAAAVHGGSAAWARLFLPYGPGEAPERLLPSVIRGLMRGETVACTQGLQLRDFVYVGDVAQALVALLDSDAEGAFNIGSGEATALRDAIAIVAAQLGGAELVQYGARRAPPGDPPRVTADIGKLTKAVGWRPKVGLHDGVERSIAYWRNQFAEGKR